MKIYNYFLMIVIVLLTLSCEEKETKDLSRPTYYVLFDIKGDNPAIVQVGEPYTDEGCIATVNGVDVTSDIKAKSNVDANTMGLYKVEYSGVSDVDDFASRAIRDVIVCNPSVTTDISGTWVLQEGTERIRQGASTPYTGFKVNIEYLAPGFFFVDDFLGGYYAQGVYPEYGSLTATYGHCALNEDNSIDLLDSHNDGWGDELSGLESASYDPESGTLEWNAIYAGMSFNLIMVKE